MVDRVVAVEHFPGFMARQFHDNGFRDAGLAHVRVVGMPEIVEGKPARDLPALNDPGVRACE